MCAASRSVSSWHPSVRIATQVVDRLTQLRRSQRWDRRRAGRVPQAVVVLGEREPGGSQPRDGQAGRQPDGQRRLQVGVGEEVVDQRRTSAARSPRSLRSARGRGSPAGARSRRDARSTGADAKPCSVVSAASSSWSSAWRHRRRASASRGWSVRAGRGVLEAGADPVTELRGGRLGERDRREVTQLDVAVGDERDDTVDERRRLAGAGTGFDEQARVVPVSDTCPGGLVADAAHSGSVRRRNPSSAGSSAFRVQVVARSAGQSRS